MLYRILFYEPIINHVMPNYYINIVIRQNKLSKANLWFAVVQFQGHIYELTRMKTEHVGHLCIYIWPYLQFRMKTNIFHLNVNYTRCKCKCLVNIIASSVTASIANV